MTLTKQPVLERSNVYTTSKLDPPEFQLHIPQLKQVFGEYYHYYQHDYIKWAVVVSYQRNPTDSKSH